MRQPIGNLNMNKKCHNQPKEPKKGRHSADNDNLAPFRCFLGYAVFRMEKYKQ